MQPCTAVDVGLTGQTQSAKVGTISKGFNRIVKAAGIDRANFHDLRKTFGTVLAEKGVNQTGISQLSDFRPQSYPNEPLDSTENDLRCRESRLFARSKESIRSLTPPRRGCSRFPRSISLWPHESPTSGPVAA